MLIPILTTLALCELSARDDHRQIERNLPIDHGVQWWIRALVVLGVCLVFCVPWLSIGLAGLFSAVFRWRLNRLRGLDWRYCSPSSWYDTAFITLAYQTDAELTMKERHQLLYRRDSLIPSRYTDAVHRAGSIAYIFEGLVFAGVLGWHLI